MSVRVEGIVDFQKQMRAYIDKVAEKRQKQAILFAGATVMKRQASKLVPKKKARYQYAYNGKKVVIKKPFYYYRKNEGKIAEILKGNLSKSMNVFRTKIGDVEVGPRVLKKITRGSVVGKNWKWSSGYYASSLLKSAEAFRKKYSERAYLMTQTKVLQAMEKALLKIHKRIYGQ